MNELVSIIIPNFNKASFIFETLDSIRVQTYSNWEVIIVDDGSTDKSIEIIGKFIEKDRRFNLFLREELPKGGSNCRNIGLNNAKGNFVIFLDSDDLLIKSCLENRVAAFRLEQELDFIVFPMGTFYKTIGDSSMEWQIPLNGYLDKFLTHDLPWAIPCPIWKRSTLMELDGFDMSYQRLQDVELHTRALLKDGISYQISKSKSPDCYYRIDEERRESDQYSFYSRWIDSVKMYLDKTYDLLIENNFHNKTSLLKGTLIKTLTSLLHANLSGKLTREQSKQLISDLIERSNDLGSRKSILMSYISMYRMGFYKLKGFNFFFQKIYTLFP